LHVVAADTRILGNILPFEEAKGTRLQAPQAERRSASATAVYLVSRRTSRDRGDRLAACGPRPSYNDFPACEGGLRQMSDRVLARRGAMPSGR
jgi:hypothetical protein